MKYKYLAGAALAFALGLSAGCSTAARQSAVVEGKSIRIEFNEKLHSRVTAILDGTEVVMGDFMPSETIRLADGEVQDFALDDQEQESVTDSLGAGQRYTISGTAPLLKKTVTVSVYDEFPRAAFFKVGYTNTGAEELPVTGWTNNHHSITAPQDVTGPAFWSYQSGSYEARPDWVLPLKDGFEQENYLGMNDSDYGGGTPVVDVWHKDAGLGVGHIEPAPKLVSLPVSQLPTKGATLAVKFSRQTTLKPGDTLWTLRTFVAVHQGDYYQTLADYRQVMIRNGFSFDPAPEDAFEPVWCAWGYGRDVEPSQIYGALPVVKKLGFRWVTLDDGWQTAEGDWFLNPKKFPRGDRDVKALTDKIHAEGFKAQLWWAPLAVDPGTTLIEQHPEQLLLNADGSKQKITWWDSWYLCPADPAVVDYHKAIVVKAMTDWGFDGFKLDGQHMNAAPPCYNPAHKHAVPEESVEGMPKFFKAIYDTARSVKRDALVEFCPCGTAYSFFMLPFMNMSVASDPLSSWQVRTKGKTLKALAGDDIAYFGDHVEMSDGGADFASSIGVGGVVGTNFTWPVGSAGDKKKLDLTSGKEKIFGKWIGIYKDKMLSRGEYLGSLYDIGFDKPEGHAIKKGGNMYYAFFAPDWKGKVELRGLTESNYRVTNYEDGQDLGILSGSAATLDVQFSGHLLLEVRPE